ncbi:hypothetical protein P19_0195 [Aeromonas phage P19]|uniref:Uncharacterized protein n=1 Tax=Aeromonas phage vB_AdhaM_G2 TaxID=3238786 RepID=A0AB39TYI6_9CAUD|nr:hypothetical protein P19_0195 [Aeromonas phage P19]
MKMYDISLNEIEQELSSMYNGVVHTGSKPKNNSYIGMNGEEVKDTNKVFRNMNAEYLHKKGLTEVATILEKTVKSHTPSHHYHSEYRQYKNTRTPLVAYIEYEEEVKKFVNLLQKSGNLKLLGIVRLSWDALGMNDSTNDFTNNDLSSVHYGDSKMMVKVKYNDLIFWIRTKHIETVKRCYDDYKGDTTPTSEKKSIMSDEISSFINYCIVNVRGEI